MMKFLGLLCLLLSFSTHGQDWVHEGGRFPLVNQDIAIDLKQDGTYSWVERDVYDVQSESPTITSTVQKITFEPALAEVQVLEFGVLSGTMEKPIGLEKLHKRELGGPDESARLVSLELPFDHLGPGDRIWYKIQRTPKVFELPGFFNLDLIYGFLQQEKKSRVVIKSELPLYFHINDPGHVLKVESAKSLFGQSNSLTVTLEKPVLSVSAENLRIDTQDELRAETPRVQIATAQNWSALRPQIVGGFTSSKDLPERLSSIVQRLKTTPDTRSKVEKLFIWLGEEMTFTGPWSTASGWRPKELNQIMKDLSGDAKDFALLAIAILRQAGVEAEPVFVGMYSPQDHTRYLHTPIQVEHALPSTGFFNHVVIRFKENGAWMIVDPTRGLADARRSPYYLNHAWSLVPTAGSMEMAQIDLPEHGYAGATLQTEMTRVSSSEFSARTTAAFHGELSNFLKTIYFRDGEEELAKYLAAFAVVSNPKGFTYRKMDFVDRSAKDWSVEMTYSASAEENSTGQNVMSAPPHFLPLYSREGEERSVVFPAFPMLVDETTILNDAFVEKEENYDCLVRGPLVALNRKVENRTARVMVRDIIQVPSKEPPSLTDEAQIKLGAHVRRLNACMKSALLPLEPGLSGLHVPYEHLIDTSVAYSPPVGIENDPPALIAELRRLDLYLKSDPKNSALWRARGKIFRELGRVDGRVYIDEYLEEAGRALLSAVKLSPNDSENWGQLGITAFERHDFVQGLDAWYHAWPLEQRNFAVLQLGGMANEYLHKVDIALNYYSSAASLAQETGERIWAWSREAALMCEGGSNCRQALALHEKIVTAEPRNHLLLHVAARVFAKEGEFARAIELEHEALHIADFTEGRQQLVRDLISVSQNLARKEAKTSEDFSFLREHLLEARKLDAGNNTVLQLLAQMFQEYADYTHDPSDADKARAFLDELKEAMADEPELFADFQRQLENRSKEGQNRLPSSK